MGPVSIYVIHDPVEVYVKLVGEGMWEHFLGHCCIHNLSCITEIIMIKYYTS